MTEIKRLPAPKVTSAATLKSPAVTHSTAGTPVTKQVDLVSARAPEPADVDQLVHGAIVCTKRSIRGAEAQLFAQWHQGRTDVAPLGSKRKVMTRPDGQSRTFRLADSAVFEDSVTKMRWVKLPHFAQGAFGRVSIMLNVDTQERWAAKSLAYETKTKRPRTGKPEPMQLADIGKEVAAGRAFSQGPSHMVLHVKRAPGDPRSSKIYDLTRLEAGTAATAVPGVGTVGTGSMPYRNVYTARLGLDVALALESMHGGQSPLAGASANPWHSRQAVHGDIKGDNVLVLTDVQPDGTMFRLSDFGLVQPVKADMPLTGITGTPGFRAPEMFEINPLTFEFDKGYGTPADIWSVGMMLACAYNAENPFVEDFGIGTPVHNMEDYQAQVVSTDAHGKMDVDLAEASVVAGPMADFFRPLLAQNPTLGKYILLNMLHPDPAQRPTAAALRGYFSEQLTDITLQDLRTVHRSLFSEANLKAREAQLNKAAGLGEALRQVEQTRDAQPPAAKRVKR
jgi:hypothetical protein